MRDAAFRDWLSQRSWNGKPLAETAKGSRMSWLRALDRSLSAFGFQYSGLDAVHAAGSWAELLDAIRALHADWHINEAAARELAPEAADPKGQIGNVLAVARLYGHFADGRDPGYDFRIHDDEGRFAAGMLEMRETFVHRMYDFQDMRVEDGQYWEVEKSYKYSAHRDVCMLAVNSKSSEEERGKAIYERLCQSTIQGLPLSWRTKAEVAKASTELQTRFYRTIAHLNAPGRPVADLAEEGARALEKLRSDGIAGLRRGEVLNIVLSVLGSLRPDSCCWFKTTMFDKAALALFGKRLFASEKFVRAEFEVFQALLFRIRDVLDTEWEWQPESLEDVQGFLWVALSEDWDGDWGMHPDPQAVEAAMSEHDELGPAGFSVKYLGFGTPTDYWVRGKGPRASNIYPSKPIAAVAMGWVSINGGWSKHDSACSLLHRAGYEIVDANGRSVPVPDKPYLARASPQADLEKSSDAAANLVLYGPPGTGKTWRTAAEAVRLCDGLSNDDPLLADPARRAELKQRYDELFGQSRIDFVTFHQNFSYEDFVEGLRPPSGEDASSDGLRLDVHHGIFRELVTLALSGSRSTAARTVDLTGRRFFKMSLGRAGVEDQIYDSAIEGNYLSLGWGGDEDWSDSRYDGESGYRAIFDRWNQIAPGTSGNSGNISQVWCFRSSMRKGDLVVVSYGNSHVRAIGEITGAYRFVPSDPFGYHHHRNVKWLRVFDEPIPASAVYDRALVQASCYRLQDAAVRKDGLTSMLGVDGDGAPLPYVLIIDEINRANISKVFGELITLIEPDKRLGGENALRVKLPYSQDEFGVPSNLHIIGTMNTADRSIALLDTALRRRFVFREIAPDPSLLPRQVDGVPLRRVLEAVNDRIEYLIDREHRIGHAFFMGDGGKDRAAIDATMRDKVVPLLQEYFFEDWSRVAAVLGEPENKGGGFLDCRMLPDPTGGGGEPRASWSVREAFAPDAYDRLLGGPGAAPAPTPE